MTPAPAALFVCRESYQVSMRFYSLAFDSELAFPETWFDFRRDTLMLDLVREDDAAQVKNLAITCDYTITGTNIEIDDNPDYPIANEIAEEVLLMFPKLLTLSIMSGEDFAKFDSDVGLLELPPAPDGTQVGCEIMSRISEEVREMEPSARIPIISFKRTSNSSSWSPNGAQMVDSSDMSNTLQIGGI